jgi:uncharacterized protein
MDEPRMVEILRRWGTDRMVINSAADWGKSDPLKIPKTVTLMRQKGMPEPEIEKVVWHNPVSFFAKSGRLDLRELDTPVSPGQPLFEGNSILRGPRA